MSGSAATISTGVHWITSGLPGKTLQDVRHVVGRINLAAGGGMGHPERYLHESGAKIYAGSPRPDQPIVIEVPGETCESWGPAWLEWIEDLGGYLTRVDVAGDVEPVELARLRLLQLRREFNGGRVETRIRRDSMIWMQGKGEGEGCTLYLGGKTAEHRVRCYDRRGPLRIEHQWRPSSKTMGQSLPGMILKWGAGPLWRSLGERIRFKQLRWYMDLLKGESVELLFAPRASSSLADAVAQFRSQMGLSLHAMLLCGVQVSDLMRDVSVEDLNATQLAKFHEWSLSADSAGLDGQPLRDAIDRSKLGAL